MIINKLVVQTLDMSSVAPSSIISTRRQPSLSTTTRHQQELDDERGAQNAQVSFIFHFSFFFYGTNIFLLLDYMYKNDNDNEPHHQSGHHHQQH